MRIRDNLLQEPLLTQGLDDCFLCFLATHFSEWAAVLVDRAVASEDIDRREAVPFTDLEVDRVVGRGDLEYAGAEFGIDLLCPDDREITVEEREDRGLADQVLIPFIVRVYGDTGVPEHRLRPGGGDYHVPSTP